MVSSSNSLLKWGNRLYQIAFPIYRPAYAAYKAYGDRAERQFLARNISKGHVVVDAGANIGIYSKFLAKCVGSTGQVHSFEPSPENYVRLKRAMRSLPNVKVNETALSDVTGVLNLYVSKDLNVDHRTYPPEGQPRQSVQIQCIRFDDYFPTGSRVDFIKMDIQGFELHALSGGRRVISENPSIRLLLEFWPFGLKQAGRDWRQLIAELEQHGMAIRQFNGYDLEPFTPGSVNEDEDAYTNIVASRN